ncbi:hypothetical protein GCM10011338_35520 [Alteromonas lipolytica]|nr:hypothetical protein GCM10011338_35520 [Alteromonas lipolytica]
MIEAVPPVAQSVVVATLPPLLVPEPPELPLTVLPEDELEEVVVVGEVAPLPQPKNKKVGVKMVMPAADLTSSRRRCRFVVMVSALKLILTNRPCNLPGIANFAQLYITCF